MKIAGCRMARACVRAGWPLPWRAAVHCASVASSLLQHASPSPPLELTSLHLARTDPLGHQGTWLSHLIRFVVAEVVAPAAVAIARVARRRVPDGPHEVVAAPLPVPSRRGALLRVEPVRVQTVLGWRIGERYRRPHAAREGLQGADVRKLWQHTTPVSQGGGCRRTGYARPLPRSPPSSLR